MGSLKLRFIRVRRYALIIQVLVVDLGIEKERTKQEGEEEEDGERQR